jgi:hypothetical protein
MLPTFGRLDVRMLVDFERVPCPSVASRRSAAISSTRVPPLIRMYPPRHHTLLKTQAPPPYNIIDENHDETNAVGMVVHGVRIRAIRGALETKSGEGVVKQKVPFPRSLFEVINVLEKVHDAGVPSSSSLG